MSLYLITAVLGKRGMCWQGSPPAMFSTLGVVGGHEMKGCGSGGPGLGVYSFSTDPPSLPAPSNFLPCN